VKKILPLFLCAMLFISCASKRAAMVEPILTEAKVLQALAKANSVEAPALAGELITAAEKQKTDGQTEAAFIFADEAVLQFQLALQKQENKKMTDSLRTATEYLNVYRATLEERKNANRQ